MLARCRDGTRSVDSVLVHSISRGFRNLLDQEETVRQLGQHKVAIRSMTENIVARDGGKLLRLALGFSNELKSHDAHVGTMRGMTATARLGFSNGGATPFGYRLVEADTIGRTTKRKLIIDPVEAEVVRLVFQLALDGDGTSGPMGVRAIVQHLNAAGHRTRKGGEFYSSTVHEMLIREAYGGTRCWNVFDKHGNQNPDRDIVEYEVPAIVDRETYDAVQARLGDRQPSRRGPRLDSAPSLFGGLIRCGCCGKAMSPATGTSRNGTVYRYYKCAGSINKGAGACKQKAIGRDVAEAHVMRELIAWLTAPDRLGGILAALHKRKASKQESVHRRIVQLQQEAIEAEKALQNLYSAIETGILDAAEPSLQGRVKGIREKRDLAQAALERAMAHLIERPALDAQVVETFRLALVERLSNGAIESRKAWLGAIVDAIVVEPGKIRVIGRNDNFESNLRSHVAGRGPVRSSDRQWWAGPECLNPKVTDTCVAVRKKYLQRPLGVFGLPLSHFLGGTRTEHSRTRGYPLRARERWLERLAWRTALPYLQDGSTNPKWSLTRRACIPTPNTGWTRTKSRHPVRRVGSGCATCAIRLGCRSGNWATVWAKATTAFCPSLSRGRAVRLSAK